MSQAEIITPESIFHSDNTDIDITDPRLVSHAVLHGCISGSRRNQTLLLSMFQLRHRVFKQRLKWDVESFNEQETDRFDTIDTDYIITTDINNNVKGCVRLLPTTAPYMLSEVFPDLWQSQAPLPCSASVCELSRFSFEKSHDAGGYGFSGPVVRLLRNLVLYAQRNQISQYVFVTTAAIERLLVIQGVSIYRVGNVVKIGSAQTVVIFMNINQQTEEALFNHSK
ncbi:MULTISPECIES: acyl-homoserine-lactone synthase [unclassified Rahnella]|uniref:acyl-homoserine-lactone synthase n=1 Tax=unclassified Rahnella TaxID=2635087 RepID=UPI001022963C|nr:MULTISPECIES: acyl-homoserine-lactone synthase [unclassified Rahnella]